MAQTEENLERQLEEIEALSSIYENCLKIDSNTSYSLVIREGSLEASLSLSLPPDYPSISPPTYQLSAPFLRGPMRQQLSGQLEQIFLENLGECVVFLWAEEIRTFLQTTALEEFDKDTGVDGLCDAVEDALTIEALNENCPEIVTGDTLEDRRSVFQGHTARVKSVDEVRRVLAKLMGNRKIANATHNMYAYRIYCDKKKTLLQDCDDDGEDAAGGRMLHLLEILDAEDVLVVVSRWYGGTHLGPDRFKHINNVTRQVLDKAGHIKPRLEKGGKKKQK